MKNSPGLHLQVQARDGGEITEGNFDVVEADHGEYLLGEAADAAAVRLVRRR